MLHRIQLAAFALAVSAAGLARATETSGVKDDVSAAWKLSQPFSLDDLRNGKRLEFVGQTSGPILLPTANDLRLERLTPAGARWTPLVFGWRKQHTELAPASGATKRVRLFLRPFAKNTRDPQKSEVRHVKDGLVFDLHAEARFQRGGSYRLTWSYTPLVGIKRSRKLSVEFQLGEKDNDGNGNGAAVDSGPAYVCEILYRSKGTLFLSRFVLPKADPRNFTVPAVGFTGKGRHVAPPDPGYARIQQRIAEVAGANWKKRPPFALRTHYYGAGLREHTLRPGWAQVRVSDLATSAPLPARDGEATFTVFSDALFRFEKLSSNFQRLRRDKSFWRQRTLEITREALKHKDPSGKLRRWLAIHMPAAR